jgi:hypothetical protein
MAPFIRIARKPSSPQGTILFTPSSTPISSTWRSLQSGYIVVSITILITLFAEALNITISGISYGEKTDGHTYTTWLPRGDLLWPS